MKRLLLTLTLLIVLVPALLCGWVMGTSAGLHWLLTRVALPEALEIGAIEGDLIGGLRLKEVRIHTGKVTLTLGEALLNWEPAALWRRELRAEMLYLDRLRIELPPSDDEPLQLPDIRLPITVLADDIQVNGLEIVRPGQPAILINNISLRASANRGGVTVQYLDLHNDIVQLSLSGTLHPYEHYWHNIELQWQLQPPGWPAYNGNGRLEGDLRHTTLQQRLNLPLQASAEVALTELLENPRWQAQVEIPRQPLSAIHPRWPQQRAALTARGAGDLHGAAIDDFTLDIVNSRIRGRGTLDWQEGLQWQADVETPRFDFAALWEILQVKGPVIAAGIKGHVRGDLEHLTARDVTLRAFGGTIRANGGVRWHERLAWQSRFTSEGLIQEQIWPLLALEGLGLPGGRASLGATLNGDGDGFDFTQTTLRSLGATVAGSGRLEWHPHVAWRLALNGDGIDPALWQPQRLAQWPGSLATTLRHHGSYQDGALQGGLEVESLSGTLRGYPIKLQTALAMTPQQLDIEHFRLDSAVSRIEMSGTAGEEMALRWMLDSPQLAQLHPELRGALTAHGAVHGPRAAPLLEMVLDGKKVAWDAATLGTLNGQASVRLFSWEQIEMALDATALELAGQTIERIELGASGTAAAHRLQLEVKMAQLDSQWRFEGAFDQASGTWRGSVDRARVNIRDFGQWQLRAPAPLTLRPDEAILAPLCWQQQEALLCLSGERRQGVWEGSLDGQRFDLAQIAPWLPRDLEIHGDAALKGSVRYQPQQPLTAAAEITLGAGSISYPIVAGERSAWPFEQGRWQARLDQHGLDTALNIALKGEDRITAALQLKGYDPLATPLAEQPLQGEIRAAFSDLGVLNSLLYEAQDLRGRITLDSRLGGTLGHPQLSGSLQLRDGSLEIPRLGLKIGGLQFEASSSGEEQLHYRLTARSGDGSLEASGATRLDAAAGWPTRLTLTGKMFEVSHIPEARIAVSPRLEMRMAKREIWLDGEVEVPQARLEPKEFTTATTVSGDVVIVGAPEGQAPPWLIHNRVRLILGERVSLYGFGFEGRIKGNLLLIDEPGKATAASGELSVAEGFYRAYGQNLEVEQGRLLFAGGPITNPALDLRAARRIQEVTAGIKVFGPLRQPRFELFSSPAMEQTEILSYLVLGVPLEQTGSGSDAELMSQAALALGVKGGDLLARSIGSRFGMDEMRIESSGNGDQASLIMGRYLSPRLYVGYGVGLMDAINTLTLRYQISDRWQLKAESGLNQSADMIFSIER